MRGNELRGLYLLFCGSCSLEMLQREPEGGCMVSSAALYLVVNRGKEGK